MKILTQFLKISCMTLFCGMLLLACSPDEPEANPEPDLPNSAGSVNTNVNVDSISNHLQFFNATKIQGYSSRSKAFIDHWILVSIPENLSLRRVCCLGDSVESTHEQTK